MEGKIKSAINFQKDKLKENYSIQRAGHEEVIDPDAINQEMNKLEQDLIDMVNKSYHPKEDAWKRTRNILFKSQFVHNYYDHPIQILYTITCKWKIMIIMNKTEWHHHNKNIVIDKVEKLGSMFDFNISSVDILERESSKWIEFYVPDQPLYEFYTILFAKLVLLFAHADISI